MSTRAPHRRSSRSARVLRVGDFARYDLDRRGRTGLPEVILGEGKSPDHLVQILWGLHAEGHGAVISRITPAQLRRLRPERKAGLPLTFLAGGRVAQLAGPVPKAPPGVVAILTAGTADVPVAEEAREVLLGLGVDVRVAYDVGVAGLHRLLGALRALARVDPDVFIAFAGREGALPTVLAGLVRAPVIAVPTSVGYGRGGQGEAALNALLQACSPVAVVNIDASVPAALGHVQVPGAVGTSYLTVRDPRR